MQEIMGVDLDLYKKGGKIMGFEQIWTVMRKEEKRWELAEEQIWSQLNN